MQFVALRWGHRVLFTFNCFSPFPSWSLGAEVPPVGDGHQREWVEEETIRYQKDEKTL